MAEDKNQEDAENFGLPDIEYKPLDQLDSSKPTEEPKQEPEPSASTTTSTYYEEEEEGSRSGVVITLIVIVVLAVGGFLAYKYVWVPKQEKAKLALLEEARKKKEQARADSLARVAEEDRLKAEAANAKPAEGTIETLADRTGRYYVVISSSVDGDLAMDRAKKLSSAGKSTKIIPPFGKWKYYRLCIGDFDSFATAQSNADASKAEFGDALWVLKY